LMLGPRMQEAVGEARGPWSGRHGRSAVFSP
jgi:hypothetical protein